MVYLGLAFSLVGGLAACYLVAAAVLQRAPHAAFVGMLVFLISIVTLSVVVTQLFSP